MNNIRYAVIFLLLMMPVLSEAREESLQEVPVAITALSEETLSSSGLTNVGDLVRNINVMPFTGTSTGQPYTSQPQIRGLGSLRGQTLMDGVPQDNPGGQYLGSLSRVEVLKGPQSALFGQANVASIIRLNREGFGTGGIVVPDISQFKIDPYFRYNSADDLRSFEFINDVVGEQWVNGYAALPHGQLFSSWREGLLDTTWADIYGGSKVSRLTDYNLDFDYYSRENNKNIIYKDTDYPNDPLYPKRGSKGKTSKARKAFGSLLSLVELPVDVSKDQASAQWGLPETGFHRRGSGNSAWDVVTGEQKNVVVAVIDSGLDLSHVDGPAHVWTNDDEIAGNGIDDDKNGYIDDIHGWNFFSETNDITDNNGHGTFVAGIIAAKTNNGEGIAGINPGARIMPLKVLNHEGRSRILSVYRAIRYAVDNGARVLNLSLGGRGITRLEQIGINYAYAMGCIVVVAAGNESSDIALHGPPGARRAFSVAAIDMEGKPRESSNRGLNVAVTAPGDSIYSLAAKEGNRDGKFMPLMVGKYFRAGGTSFSAPFVAGTASLIWSKYPDLGHRMVEDMILQSAKDIHAQGWDTHTGYGLLNAYGALTQDPMELLVPRVTEVYVNKEKRRIASVDIYGVIRGNLDHYKVSVGRGKKPDKWQTVHGPVSEPVDYRLIGRIDGAYFSKGSKWTVKVDAVDRKQRIKSVRVFITKSQG